MSSFTIHYRTLTVEKKSYATVITFKCKEGKNMISLDTVHDLKDALAKAEKDPRPAVVITGHGNTFCSGIESSSYSSAKSFSMVINELFDALRDMKKPLLVAVNGEAVGLGVTLLDFADRSFGVRSATFRMPQELLGSLWGDGVVSVPVPVTSTEALHHMLRGASLTAEDACELGLLTEVVERKHMEDVVATNVVALLDEGDVVRKHKKDILLSKMKKVDLYLENDVPKQVKTFPEQQL